MSNLDLAIETQQQQQKGLDSFLSQEERAALQRMLGFPEDLPPAFQSWVIDFMSVNLSQISISQILGFEKLLYRKGTAFPSDPKDGQMFGLAVDSGHIWQFRYDNDIGDAYKWVFTGGAPLTATATANVNTTSVSYVDLGGGTPGVVVPKAGIYRVDHGCTFKDDAASGAKIAYASIYAGTTPTDDDAVETRDNAYSHSSRAIFPTITSASTTVKQQYRISNSLNTANYYNRWIAVLPVRLG